MAVTTNSTKHIEVELGLQDIQNELQLIQC